MEAKVEKTGEIVKVLPRTINKVLVFETEDMRLFGTEDLEFDNDAWLDVRRDGYVEQSPSKVLEQCRGWFSEIVEKCDAMDVEDISKTISAIRSKSEECVKYVDSYIKKRNEMK